MKIFQLLQIIFAVLLILFILIQNSGTGLSGVFGGSSNVYRTKRGAEKTIFILTIITSILFIVISLAGVILNKA
jgi:preprotein translocase subunit SecG